MVGFKVKGCEVGIFLFTYRHKTELSARMLQFTPTSPLYRHFVSFLFITFTKIYGFVGHIFHVLSTKYILYVCTLVKGVKKKRSW